MAPVLREGEEILVQPSGMLLQQAKRSRTAGTLVTGMQALGASPSMNLNTCMTTVTACWCADLSHAPWSAALRGLLGCTCGAVAALRAGIHWQVDHGGHAGVAQAQVRRLVVAVVGAAAEQRVRHAERHLQRRKRYFSREEVGVHTLQAKPSPLRAS